MQIVVAATAAWLLTLASVQASDEASWERFRQEVEASCLAAVAGVLEDARAIVDPFGSPSFGLAVVRGREAGGQGRASVICVYDKSKRTVEIGSAVEEADDGGE
jgi:hypothetical protein